MTFEPLILQGFQEMKEVISEISFSISDLETRINNMRYKQCKRE